MPLTIKTVVNKEVKFPVLGIENDNDPHYCLAEELDDTELNCMNIKCSECYFSKSVFEALSCTK